MLKIIYKNPTYIHSIYVKNLHRNICVRARDKNARAHADILCLAASRCHLRVARDHARRKTYITGALARARVPVAIHVCQYGI